MRWISRFEVAGTTPLDGFPSSVAQKLRDAADQDIDAVIRRITVEGARLVAEGHHPHPVPRVAVLECDVTWLIHAEGPLSKKEANKRFLHQSHFKITELNQYVFPTDRDLVPFLIRIGLDTGIPIESLKTLSADCLRNADRGKVTIRYLKRRGKVHRWKTKVVRDGHPMSPGGLIRTVLTLTRRARELTGSQRLWVGLARWSELEDLSFAPPTAVRRFVRDHDLRHGETGSGGGESPLLALDLRRLRKTHKVERIRATRGRARDWADDHSIRVAVNRYGMVPELRSEHEAAIEAALTEALAVADGDAPSSEAAGRVPESEQQQIGRAHV